MIPLVTAEEMRAIEQEFVESGGDLDSLMTRAGEEVAARISSPARALFLVGPGNNGDDARAAAAVLRRRGDEAFVYNFGRKPEDDVDGASADVDAGFLVLRQEMQRASVVVDGLLGTGRRRPVEGPLAEIISAVNESCPSDRLAIDIPTGVDANTGQVGTVAFRATRTVTLGFGKRGLWSFPGADFGGRVEVADIGLSAFSPKSPACALVTPEDVAPTLPRRTLDWNKGKGGTVLVVAGSDDYRGAPVLTANAAYRAGAGLVAVAVPTSARSSVATATPESIFAPIEASSHHFVPASVSEMEDVIGRVKAFAVGPGLGTQPETVEFVHALLERFAQADLPGVVDADALNALAQRPNWWKNLPAKAVLTPHPGEMGRLTGSNAAQVQADRFGVAAESARKWGVTVLLKGAFTLVASAGGDVTVNPTGGPNLGTAGTGDVLTGIVSSFTAQGLSPRESAVAGAFVHGMAGQLLREELGDAGTMASDIWRGIPRVCREMIQHDM